MQEGVHGRLLDKRTIEVCADSQGRPMPVCRGMYRRKKGQSMPFAHFALKDGSGIVVQFGDMPGILFKTDDLNKEAENVLDEAIDLKRAVDPIFDGKYKSALQRNAVEALKGARNHSPLDMRRKLA